MPEGFDLAYIEGIYADADDEFDTDEDLVYLRNDGTVTWAGDAEPWPGMTTICPTELGGPFQRLRATGLVDDFDPAVDGVGPLVIVEMS